MTLKSQVHRACIDRVVQRINHLEQQLGDLRNQLESDGKSSAGDKHETGRAMLHLEQEQIAKQLHDANSQLAVLKSIQPLTVDEAIKHGSLVETSSGQFYISGGFGKLSVDELDVMTVSTQSPLGQALLGKKSGDNLTFGNKLIRIISVK